MGLFSKWKKADVAKSAPTIEEQKAEAKASVDAFINQLYSGWDNSREGSFDSGYFKIAGITHYCDFSDVGMVRGMAFNDPKNPYDKTAVALVAVSSDGKQKLLGHIAKDENKAYKNLVEDSDKNVFIGYIRRFETYDGEKGILGRLKVYYGDDGTKLYNQMIADTQVILGAFRGYYKDELLKDTGEKLEWILESHF